MGSLLCLGGESPFVNMFCGKALYNSTKESARCRGPDFTDRRNQAKGEQTRDTRFSGHGSELGSSERRCWQIAHSTISAGNNRIQTQAPASKPSIGRRAAFYALRSSISHIRLKCVSPQQTPTPLTCLQRRSRRRVNIEKAVGK